MFPIPVMIGALLGGAWLIGRKNKGADEPLDPSLDAQVERLIKDEKDPTVLRSWAERLRAAGLPQAASRLADKASDLESSDIVGPVEPAAWQVSEDWGVLQEALNDQVVERGCFGIDASLILKIQRQAGLPETGIWDEYTEDMTELQMPNSPPACPPQESAAVPQWADRLVA